MAKKFLSFALFFLMAAVIPGPAGSQPAPSQPLRPKASPQATPPETAVPPGPATRQTAPSPAAPGVAPAAGAGVVSLNFNQADLVEVIHVLAQHLKLTYTIDPGVRGTVTIHSSEPLKKEDLLPVFHQILRMNGAVAVKRGELYRIVPIKEGKSLAWPSGLGREDNFTLQVVPVRFFSVGEMKRLLNPFLTPGGEILDYPRGNFLIVADLPSNIARLMEIKDLIDVNALTGVRMEIYQPKVASAEELAAEMTKIMQAYASSTAQAEGFAAQFLPIPRINQLLVINHSEAAWTYVQRWLKRIDSAGEGPGRRIFIYPVENGKATELADILNQVLGQTPVSRREAPKTLQDLHRGSSTGPGGLRSTTPSLGGSTQSPTSQSTAPGAYAAVPAPAPAGQPRPAAPSPSVAPTTGRTQEQMRIVPDPATNSLIIYGTAQEFQNIKNILRDLDIIPRQVLLDVLVAEVSLGDDMKFGVEYEIQRKTGDVRIFDREFGSRGAILSGVLPPAATSGLSQFPGGLSGVIGTGDALRLFINALMSDSRVKVLSSPSVLATDNRPARIQVGTEEPVPTGTVQSPVSGGSITSSTTIQYRNTGRIVTIIPQVNSQGLVHLQIKSEVSQRGPNVTVGQDSFPSFDTRDAETTAVVQDGETLVFGGIITERKSKDRVGIPFLMDIPVLGRFFGTTTDEVDRTELIMLITPHVIRDIDEAKGITEEFKERLSRATREIIKTKEEQQEESTAPEPEQDREP